MTEDSFSDPPDAFAPVASCGISGWGWEDDGWGAVNVNGTLLRFPSGGSQTVRIQVREDGVSVDQIVLSAVAYRTRRPETAKDDIVIVEPPHPPDQRARPPGDPGARTARRTAGLLSVRALPRRTDSVHPGLPLREAGVR